MSSEIGRGGAGSIDVSQLNLETYTGDLGDLAVDVEVRMRIVRGFDEADDEVLAEMARQLKKVCPWLPSELILNARDDFRTDYWGEWDTAKTMVIKFIEQLVGTFDDWVEPSRLGQVHDRAKVVRELRRQAVQGEIQYSLLEVVAEYYSMAEAEIIVEEVLP